jgi:hypothetical protein
MSSPGFPAQTCQREPTRVRDFIFYLSVPVDDTRAKPADRKACSLRPTYIHAIVMYQSNVFRAYTYWYILMRVEIHPWLHSSATCIGRKAHGIPMMQQEHRASAHAVKSSSNRHAMGQRRSSCIITRSSLSMDPPVVIVLTRLDHFPAVLSSIRGLDCSLATVTMRTAFTEARLAALSSHMLILRTIIQM